jgi:GNAT superfamily N-acetyltransferase
MEIVRASEKDIYWIVRHRVEMFRDMGMEDDTLAKTESLTEDSLRHGFDERSIYYLAKEDDDVVGGCAVAICKILPSNGNITGEFAYVFNMYVEKQHRRKGIASKLMARIKEDCDAMNISRLYLHASVEGAPVYLKAGFAKSENFYEIRSW